MDRLECDRMYIADMETGSFAKAAQRLKTSSGPASKLVSRLEEILGVRLLIRTTRALSPTEVGQAYFERIRRLLDDLDSLSESVKTNGGAASGRLRLTAPISFGTAQLAPALIDFAKTYPGIELDVSSSDRVVNLVDEGFDAGVRIGNPADSTLIVRKVCDARIMLAAAPAYVQSYGTPNHSEVLQARECILETNFRDSFTWQFRDPVTGITLQVPVKGRLCCLYFCFENGMSSRLLDFGGMTGVQSWSSIIPLIQSASFPRSANRLLPLGNSLRRSSAIGASCICPAESSI
jgi:DNA-binding transcriptional LysR family regulator